MTESTQMHTTAENNNSAGVKMEPPVSPAPSEQQYSLKWNDFQTSILSSFRHLRDEEDFVDVTLACDHKSFTAHKVVLSACSPYFRKLLKANPCEHPIVILRDVRAEDVESLLRFMYNGEVHIGHEQLSDFLKTAQLLQVRGLADVTGPTNTITSSATTATATTTSSSIIGSTALANRTSNSTLNSSLSTPGVQELKASPTSTSLPWDLQSSDERSNQNTPNPPPQKRVKSAELYRVQHGLSPERLRDHMSPLSQHPLQRSRGRDLERNLHHHSRERDRSRDSRDPSLEMRESLLEQALEVGPTLILPSSQSHADLSSIQAQSTGEDSNSSDAGASDRDDDGPMDGINGSMDHPRTPTFPGSFLGLQGIQGLIPGPSGMHGADNFVSRRSLEMRVRATDPRPCPKCGKIYRSAHTLRTHLEDKHTVCPGYRCVLCGTVAKSRNSLHSHMSRQHRGISTKDLPVLPMPSPFDPELASRLLAKAGVKISAAELRARASPTSGTRRNDIKLELRQPGDENTMDDMDNDPEDLTMGPGGNNNNGTGRYHDGLMGLSSPFNHPGTTISRIRQNAMTPKSMEQMSKDGHGGSAAATGSALLDTYLQFITENAFGMGMTQEQAAAAMHAAKFAQMGAIGHNLDKLPAGLLPPQFDLTKIDNTNQNDTNNSQTKLNISTPSVTIEPTPKMNTTSQPHLDRLDIRRDSSEPMDLGHENDRDRDREHESRGGNIGNQNDGGTSSGDDANYSDDEAGGNS